MTHESLVHDLEERRSAKKNEAAYRSPYRDAYEVDYGRILHSEPFRRLQSKTQVYQTTESDFHRTRLTHSIEAAQIGRGITNFLKHKYASQLDSFPFTLNVNVIESLCLAHDLGHPPFGHGGEVALNYMMRRDGGFEGNGQTLRIISRLGKYSRGFGMDLSRRSMLGLLKYPVLYSNALNPHLPRPEAAPFYNLNQDAWYPPKCIYDNEKDVFEWILEPLSDSDRALYTQIETKTTSHHKTLYKTIDCSIMEYADDISYALHDFEDSMELNLFHRDVLNDFVDDVFKNEGLISFLRRIGYSDKKLDKMKSLRDPKWLVSICTTYLIESAQIKQQHPDFQHPYLLYRVYLDDDAEKLIELFKKMITENVISNHRIQQFVKNGQIIISKLFDIFSHNPQILPKRTQQRFEEEGDHNRIICDYLSGMTDVYALKTYSMLFESQPMSFFSK